MRNALAFCILVLGLSGCFPRAFNDSKKSQIKDTTSEMNFSQWYNSLPTGPIANYELTANVVFHKVGSELIPDFSTRFIPEAKMEKRIDYVTSGSNKGSADGGVSMVWMRDYQPIVIKSSDPKAGGKARFISYLSINQARSAYNGTVGMGGPSADLLGPHLISIDKEVIGTEVDSISLIRMPLLIEGGNLVSTGEHVFLTEHIFQQNSRAYIDYLNKSGRKFDANSLDKIYRENGFYTENELGEKFEYRTPEQVRSVLSKYLEVKSENIVTLPMLPGEGTHHVDLFLLAMGRKQVMVPEITDAGISALAFDSEKPLARAAQEFLNTQANLLRSRYGYQVDRLEMLPPIFQIEQGGEKQAVYFSPANVLLANLDGVRKNVFIPHFEVPADWGQPFRAYSAKIEEQWKSYFSKNGWQPMFITANKAARAYGLIRCLTASVPFVSERHMNRFLKLKY